MGAETFPEIANNLSVLTRISIYILTHDGKSFFKLYKTQFEVVTNAQGCDAQRKAFKSFQDELILPKHCRLLRKRSVVL